MIRYGDTYESLSKSIGMTRAIFCLKINGKVSIGFTQREIQKIKDRYNLTAEEIDEIFFQHKVSKKEIKKEGE